MPHLISISMWVVGLLALASTVGAQTTVSHGSSIHGELKYPPDFTHFEYVNPDAPKGGDLRLSATGSFDSLHPFILKGDTAAGVGLLFETLLTSSSDEASSSYGLLAESVEVPHDKSWVAFKLRPEARWHDGSPVTVDDVIFSFDILKSVGHPTYRTYYKSVARAERMGPGTVKFTFSGGLNHELPNIVGQLPVLQKAYFENRDFEKTTLEPIMGSGPYRVVEVDPGRSITYERIEDYWGADLPVNRGQYNFGRIRWDYFRDRTVAREAFKSNEFDFWRENRAGIWATGYDIPAVRDGLIIKEDILNSVPSPHQAFVFNLRRELFVDSRVRLALSYAFDFEWTNKNLFHGHYSRTTSYFPNTELASSGLPSAEELQYLEPFRGQIPEEVFTQEFKPPQTEGTGNIRSNLRTAQRLLRKAGWRVRDGKLTNEASGQVMAFEIMLVSPAFERIVLPFKKNLEKLGVEVRVRLVDSAQYQNRLNEFDFDLTVNVFTPVLSPGNEQREFWSSESADIPGSRNVTGIKNPVIDALIEKIISAPDRASLVTATRAMDRVLLWNHYVISNWHSPEFNVAYWNRFSRPTVPPKYSLGIFTWWVDPAKDAALKQKTSRRTK